MTQLEKTIQALRGYAVSEGHAEYRVEDGEWLPIPHHGPEVQDVMLSAVRRAMLP